MGAANKLKELFDKNQPDTSGKDKARIEQLRKALQEKLKKDPKLNKKAAMIIEQMMNQKPPKK
jgi:hypothetical protein